MKIIGISGVTNGGKSTLSRMLLNELKRSAYICQDKYFHSRDSGKLEYSAELNSHNYDCIEAIDTEAFYKDLNEILNKSDLYDFLIIDGFLLLRFENLSFERKYFFTLSKSQCLQKRLNRNYKTVGSLDYFESLVWPTYTDYYDYCKSKHSDIIYLDGNEPIENTYNYVKTELFKNLL